MNFKNIYLMICSRGKSKNNKNDDLDNAFGDNKLREAIDVIVIVFLSLQRIIKKRVSD